MRFEKRLWGYGLIIALPGMIISGLFSLSQDLPGWGRVLVVVTGFMLPIILVSIGINRIRHPLLTLSNQVAGMREGDFSIRARGEKSPESISLLVSEINALSEHLREHRLEGVEKAALLKTVMEEISVAVFAFDQDQILQLANKAGEQLIGRSSTQMKSRSAKELGLSECLQGEPSRILNTSFSGRFGRWGLRRSSFRDQGKPHQLIVISDLSRTLREEERQAWKRLIRVIGHELNNSLAPIQSISSSLEKLLDREPRAEDWESDMKSGLSVIQSRSEALSRFMEAYARLARLPVPRKTSFSVQDWVRRVTQLERRLVVKLLPGPELTLTADRDQLEQLLINLIRNAVEAALSKQNPVGAGVEVQWFVKQEDFILFVRDNGPGISAASNLFVPFFTTKQDGTGIGLALCRQIAEAHNGLLDLRNRNDGEGAEAVVQIPRV